MAGCHMSRQLILQKGRLSPAEIPGVTAAGMKTAAGGNGEAGRDVVPENDRLAAVCAVDSGNSGDQCFSIRVPASFEQF